MNADKVNTILGWIVTIAMILLGLTLFAGWVATDDVTSWQETEDPDCINKVVKVNEWFFEDTVTTITRLCEMAP